MKPAPSRAAAGEVRKAAGEHTDTLAARLRYVAGGAYSERKAVVMLEAADEIDRAQKDAERYRYLRDHELSPWAAVRAKGAKTAADIDAAFDDAIAKARGEVPA